MSASALEHERRSGAFGRLQALRQTLAARLLVGSVVLATLVGIGVAAAILGWWLRRRGPVRDAAPALFLSAAAAGALVLWSTWETWFGYPSDWDITAILALTGQAIAVLAIARSPWPRARLAGLGAAAGISAYSVVSLASMFAQAPA